MAVQAGERQLLLHGMTMVLAGLVWGLFVPHTPYPRLALGAHIQFESSGVLFIVVATLLLKLEHRAGIWCITILLLSAWLTWAMALSEVGNAWWGTTQMLPIAGAQAGAPGAAAWQENLVKLTHIGAGLSLILGWTLLLIGFVRVPASS